MAVNNSRTPPTAVGAETIVSSTRPATCLRQPGRADLLNLRLRLFWVWSGRVSRRTR
jgi:hypothetical protein